MFSREAHHQTSQAQAYFRYDHLLKPYRESPVIHQLLSRVDDRLSEVTWHIDISLIESFTHRNPE